MNEEQRLAFYTSLYASAVENSCARCKRSFSHRVVENVTNLAKFYLGDKAPRYCNECVEIISEQQWMLP